MVITVGVWDLAVSGWGRPTHLVFGGWTFSAVPITSGISTSRTFLSATHFTTLTVRMCSCNIRSRLLRMEDPRTQPGPKAMDGHRWSHCRALYHTDARRNNRRRGRKSKFHIRHLPPPLFRCSVVAFFCWLRRVATHDVPFGVPIIARTTARQPPLAIREIKRDFRESLVGRECRLRYHHRSVLDLPRTSTSLIASYRVLFSSFRILFSRLLSVLFSHIPPFAPFCCPNPVIPHTYVLSPPHSHLRSRHWCAVHLKP